METSAPAQRQGRLNTLVHLAWPAIIEQLLGTMVSYVDTAMVGLVGPTATAAVGINAACIWLCNSFLGGIGVGYSVQAANAIGAGDAEQARTVTRQGLLATIASGALVLALFQCLAGSIPRWLGAEPDVLPYAVSYLRFYSLGLPFAAMVAIFSAILRCLGDTKRPLIFNATANLLNVVLNFFLIYPTRTVSLLGLSFSVPGAGLGVAGAAIASALSLAVGGLLTLWSVFDPRRTLSIGLREDYRPDSAVIRRAARLGIPYIAERFTVNIGQLLMTRVVASLGTVAIAANHIAVTAEGMCYLPAYGVSFAATALVGQAVGARNKEDARAYGNLAGLFGFGICVFTGAALFLLATPLSSLFSPDPEVIALSAQVLRIVSVSEPMFAVSIVLSGALRGANDVKFPMFLALGCMWGVRVLLAPILVFYFHIGLAGVWAAMALDIICRGLLCIWRWKSGRWLRHAGLADLS